MGCLLNVVGDICGRILADAGPDGAGQAFMDSVNLIRETGHYAEVVITKEVEYVTFVGEAQCSA